MATLSSTCDNDIDSRREANEKQNLKAQQEQYRQLQRDLADAISRLAPLDDIRILLASGAKPNLPVTQGLHPIHYAVYQNFLAAVRLLILRGCDINAMDDNGYTPVHLCAERGYYQLLEYLIQNRAKYNSSLADEPLSLALRKAHLDCAELLQANLLFDKLSYQKLKSGADPNARYFMGSEINRVNILKVSAIKLLLKYGADPDSRDRSGLSPLMRAARNPLGYASVKVLIDHGADVNDIASEKHDYRTILHHSIFSGNVELIRLVLTSGAKYPILNFDKPSPLDIAIISGSPEIVKLLIEFNADVNHGARSIGLPLSVALTQQIRNKYDIVKLLLDGGADPNSLVVSSTRTCGPPLRDYLQSMHQFGDLSVRRQRRWPSLVEDTAGADQHLAFVRMLLNYGARVLLVKTSQSHLLGLVRTLERLHDELSLELLHLLIDAAELIDWLSISKVLYNCLRLSNKRTAFGASQQLNDPSESANIGPQTIVDLLLSTCGESRAILEDIVKRIGGCVSPLPAFTATDGSSGAQQEDAMLMSALSLKQIARIRIRHHQTQRGVRGRCLTRRISQMPVPITLKHYLAFQCGEFGSASGRLSCSSTLQAFDSSSPLLASVDRQTDG